MSSTLLQMSEWETKNEKRSNFLRMFAQNSDILNAMCFVEIRGGSWSYVVEGTLPGVAFRGSNGIYGQVGAGIVNPQTDFLKIAGGDLNVDAQIIRSSGEEVRDEQEMMKVKALALNITGCIINGDRDNNIREFDGIKKRIVGNQLVPANLNHPYTNSPLSLAALDEAIKRVDEPTHLIMAKATRSRLSSAARTFPDIDITWEEDAFGRKVMFYKKLLILIADYNDRGERIIDFNEDGLEDGILSPPEPSTSIYVVSIGPEKFTGLQNGEMEVEDHGLINNSVVYRTRVEWLMGIAVLHGKAMARVLGITAEPVTE